MKDIVFVLLGWWLRARPQITSRPSTRGWYGLRRHKLWAVWLAWIYGMGSVNRTHIANHSKWPLPTPIARPRFSRNAGTEIIFRLIRNRRPVFCQTNLDEGRRENNFSERLFIHTHYAVDGKETHSSSDSGRNWSNSIASYVMEKAWRQVVLEIVF